MPFDFALIVPVVLAIVLFVKGFRIINEYETGIVFRLGRYAGTRGAGPRWIIPFVDRMVIVDIGPEIAPAGGARVGQLMATSPEHFETLEAVVTHMRANAPLYSEALLRQRAEHAVRPLPGGGFTWKYDRGLRDAIRQGRLRLPADLWDQWRAITCLASASSMCGRISVLKAWASSRNSSSQPIARSTGSSRLLTRSANRSGLAPKAMHSRL